jgi:hypothetical protein
LAELEKLKLLVDGGRKPTPAMAEQFTHRLAGAIVHAFRSLDIARSLGLVDDQGLTSIRETAPVVWNLYYGNAGGPFDVIESAAP